jgi:hypothetical protein
LKPEIASLVNSAPRFNKTFSLIHSFQIDDKISDEEKLAKMTYEIKLPWIEDDEQALAEVSINSKTLGNAKWKNVTGVVHQEEKQILHYDFKNRLMEFKFQNYFELEARNGSHLILITLKDERGKQREYRVTVFFKIKP